MPTPTAGQVSVLSPGQAPAQCLKLFRPLWGHLNVRLRGAGRQCLLERIPGARGHYRDEFLQAAVLVTMNICSQPWWVWGLGWLPVGKVHPSPGIAVLDTAHGQRGESRMARVPRGRSWVGSTARDLPGGLSGKSLSLRPVCFARTYSTRGSSSTSGVLMSLFLEGNPVPASVLV